MDLRELAVPQDEREDPQQADRLVPSGCRLHRLHRQRLHKRRARRQGDLPLRGAEQRQAVQGEVGDRSGLHRDQQRLLGSPRR